jgi:hypothetical protein
MWIVKLALQRPYTFVVMALLILLLGITSIKKTPGLRRGPVKRGVAFPVESTRIRDDALNRRRRVIAVISGRVATVVLWNNGAASVRIDENFGRIEAHSTRRIEGTVNAVTIDLPCFHAGYEYVPIVIRSVGRGIDRDHTLGPSIINAIKEEEFDTCCVL